jgi:hypothetical protein
LNESFRSIAINVNIINSYTQLIAAKVIFVYFSSIYQTDIIEIDLINLCNINNPIDLGIFMFLKSIVNNNINIIVNIVVNKVVVDV